MTSPPELKRLRRQDALSARLEAHRRSGADAAARVARHVLTKVPLGRRRLVVGGYWPVRSELDPRPLIDALGKAGHGLSLPVVVGMDVPLVFRVWRAGDALRRGPFGIREPLFAAPAAIPDVVLVPMVAFDRTGMRLGYGGGFYDRTLRALRRQRRLLAIGLAFAAQEVEGLPVEPQDEWLDCIVTENGLLRPKTRSA